MILIPGPALPLAAALHKEEGSEESYQNQEARREAEELRYPKAAQGMAGIV